MKTNEHFGSLLCEGERKELYYHRTDGGAEYLYDTYIECPNGHKEGALTNDTEIIIRVDGGEIEICKGLVLMPEIPQF